VEKFIPILIINWNGIEDTEECLESLEHLKDVNFKVFLADNDSDEENKARLKVLDQKYEWLELFYFDDNHGFTLGSNMLLEILYDQYRGQFDYVAMLNNDTTADPYWLSSLLKTARKKEAHIIACKMIDYFNHEELDNLGHRMINTGEIVPIAFRKNPNDYHDYIENYGSCAGATLYDAKMLEDIGYFDLYFNTGYEDAEIGARALVTGYKCITDPHAVVYHKISRSVNKIHNFEYVLQIQKSIFYTFFKLMPLPVVLINIPSIIIKYLMVMVFDIVFLRFNYLKMLIKTLHHIFFKDWNEIADSRKAFQSKHELTSSWTILKKQEFFLWFDIKRFYDFVILRKKSEFDRMEEKK